MTDGPEPGGFDELNQPGQPEQPDQQTVRPPQRLSPLTPMVRGFVVVVAVGFASLDDLLTGEVGPFAIILLAVLLGGFVYGYASWLRTRFWITADELRIDTGVLYHQSRRIRIDRLQGVDIVQPFVARLFGLAEVRVDVAGGDREGSLAYLPLADAHQVREVLLARRDAVRRSAAPAGAGPDAATAGPGEGTATAPGVDPAWAPPDHEIARLDLPTLLLSMLLSLETILTVASAVALGVVALVAGGAVAIPLLPVLAGFALVSVRRLSAYYGFTVSQTRVGLQVRRGLFEKSTQTIALARVQGVLLSEPVLWRRMGWAKLDVAVAGYGSGSDSDGGPSATTVMPVAPRALVVQLAGHLLGGDPAGGTSGAGEHLDPDAVPLTPPPRQARWLDPFARRFMGAGTSEHLVASREGWFTRRTHVVRHARVQSLRLTQGPLERWLGLADVHVDSPPGPVHVVARHRDVADARDFLEREQVLAEAARGHWPVSSAPVTEPAAEPAAATQDPPPAEAAPGTPDVTVIIPVYNTMPYLTACLQSMVDQTIGADRMEVVAVDDGSTDGSGEELDRYAEKHPDLFTVLHQENSGGPASPCNAGLEVARGRYVFFIGADDYLPDYALEKLVDTADEWESDVIWGKVEGVGGRGIPMLLFDETRRDIPFPNSKLPFALANSKLFRRSLIEEHGIRYPLDLRVGSDQPFTIAAMLHARRISVLADQPYYYGVRREDAGNITFSSGWKARLEDIGTVMDHVAELLPPGEKRDRILHRHFAWELNRRLRLAFPELPEDEQAELAGLVADLADRYLTDFISDRLTVPQRLRIRMAQQGRLDLLRAMVRAEQEEWPQRVAVRDGRVFLVWPGYGDLPDEWFEARADNVVKRMAEAVRVTALTWQGSVLHVEGTGPLLHPDSAGSVWLELLPLPGKHRVAGAVRRSRDRAAARKPLLRVPVVVKPDAGGTTGGSTGGSTVRAELDLAALLHRAPGKRRRWAPRLVVDAGPRVFDLPLVAGPAVERDTTTLVPEPRSGGWYRLHARVGREQRVVLVREPVPVSDVPRRDRLRAKVSRLRPR